MAKHQCRPGLTLTSTDEAQDWMVSEQSNILAFALATAAEDAGYVVREFTRCLFILGHHIDMPRRLVAEFTRILQLSASASGRGVSKDEMLDIFTAEYLSPACGQRRITLLEYTTTIIPDKFKFEGIIDQDGISCEVRGIGIGPISAFVDSLLALEISVRVVDFTEHVFDSPVDAGAEVSAIAYIECEVSGQTLWGVGIDSNTLAATFRAITSAVNRSFR
jgi:2-isopropylmalate synthase